MSSDLPKASGMSNGSPKRHPVDETFIEEFSTRILEKAAGTAPEYAILHGTAPKRLFFNGVLCGSPESQTTAEKQIHEIYRPTSCGLDFICRSGVAAKLKIRLSFNVFGVFYQPFETLGVRQAPVGDYLPTLSYMRFPISFETSLALSDIELGMHEISHAGSGLNEPLARVSADIASRSDALRDRDGASPKTLSLREWTESAYASALHLGEKVPQTWKCSVFVQASDTEAGRRIQLFLQNVSLETEGTLTLDRNFYGSEISIEIDPSVLNDIPLERAPLNDYRYRRSVIVQGINCNSRFDADNALRTCFTPSFRQMRYLPLESYDLSFARVRTDPDSVFDEIDAGLKGYASAWRDRLKIGELDIGSEDDLRIAREFFDTFLNESERIRQGINLVRKDALVREAFLHMNSTFKHIGDVRASRGERPIGGWYLFQLCFILSLVPAFVRRNVDSANRAQLLWFPTGGGKTEAVMGIVVLAMFYERLTGREFGVTSWMRFPLRLLTFQQMQRYVDVVIAADEVRMEASKASERLRTAPFTIGYFGGRRNSPNDLRYIPEEIDAQSLYHRLKSHLQRNPRGMDVLLDEEGRHLFQDLRIVGDCFYCGEIDSVEIIGDPTSLTMRHKCTKCERYLPIFTTDEDVYTQLPTVMVGTLDKLATIGFRSAFRTLIGKSDGRCEKHGYGIFGRCLKSHYGECSHVHWRARRTSDPPYGGISILFQDELHLIHEQLGCFDAHYESLLISLCTEAGGKAPLIIAASATIEGADHQLEHLYEAEEVRFPGEGPSLRETFYARETPDLQRLYVGIRPSNLAHLDTTMSLTSLLFDEISELRNKRTEMAPYYPSLRPLSQTEYDLLLDRHTLTVAYVNSKREGQNIYRSVDEQVRDNLKRLERDEIYGITSLTGDSTMDDVKAALRRMKARRSDLSDKEKLDFAVATSMISHGVDVDRLNMMIFFSYPRTTAEYIQASSRAGRTYPGIVFVVLKSTTYRDRSFYRNFREVHAALDKMVETVPIDRFAVHAVQRTVPGLAVGTLINRSVDGLRKSNKISLEDAREIDNIQTLKRLVIRGMHFKDVVKTDLDGFYRVSDSRAADWRAEIARILDNLDTNISVVGERSSIPGELNHTETRVMTSLRDVDPPLEILIRDRISTEKDEGE
jgi:hypothetical protein